MLLQPFSVGLFSGQAVFNFIVVDDTAFFHVDEEHASGLQATFVGNVLRWNVYHAGFRRGDDGIVLGHEVASGSQAVSV